MLNPRGISPCVGVQPIGLSLPLVWSIRNPTMLLCPRFEPYTQLPLRWTMISAVALVPVKSGGSVDMVCSHRNVPCSAW